MKFKVINPKSSYYQEVGEVIKSNKYRRKLAIKGTNHKMWFTFNELQEVFEAPVTPYTKLPKHMRAAIRLYVIGDHIHSVSDEELNQDQIRELYQLSPRACVAAWLNYEGICNFTDDIIDLVLISHGNK